MEGKGVPHPQQRRQPPAQSVARLSDFVRQRRLRAQRTMCSRQCWYSKLDIDLIILDQIGRAGAVGEALRRST